MTQYRQITQLRNKYLLCGIYNAELFEVDSRDELIKLIISKAVVCSAADLVCLILKGVPNKISPVSLN